MPQRRLRPGDVLDDYCLRERRLTDHAVVAMIGDDIKQTRCMSCDTEHEYKEGRVPSRKKKEPGAALFGQVLDNLQPPASPSKPSSSSDEPASNPVPLQPGSPESVAPELVPAKRETIVSAPPSPAPPSPAPPSAAMPLPDASSEVDERDLEPDDPVMRPLIRAVFPRMQGQPPPTRPLPDFTARHARPERPSRPGAGSHFGVRRRGDETSQFPSAARSADRRNSPGRPPHRDVPTDGGPGNRNRRTNQFPARGGKKR